MLEKINTSLSRRLVFLTIVLSSIVTFALTIFRFYIEYNTEVDILEETIHQIERSSVDSLSKALWDVDRGMVDMQLKGLLQVGDVVYVRVVNKSGAIVSEVNRKTQNDTFLMTKDFALKKTTPEQVWDLGILHLELTKRHMNHRLLINITYFFLSQGLKTFVTSFIFFLLFQTVITRNVIAISRYFRTFSLEDDRPSQMLRLEKKATGDELDFLVSSINDMHENLIEKNRKLKYLLTKEQEALAQEKKLVLQSSGLANIASMAGNIAHEVNTPLAIIVLLNENIMREMEKFPPNIETIKDYCSKLSKQTKRIEVIMKALGNLPRRFGWDTVGEYDLHEILSDVKNISQDYAAHLQVPIEFPQTGTNPRILCRKNQISQVIVQLIHNSLDAVSHLNNPVISIETHDDPSQVRILVRNNGAPINANIRNQIFAPFVTTKMHTGAGLGLFVSRRIVEDHGGEIFLDESTKETCFVIQLPKIASSRLAS